MFDALVVSVVADGANPVMSVAAGCAHDGAKPAVPVPVWLRNYNYKKLIEAKEKEKDEIDKILSVTPEEMWLNDLVKFEEEYRLWLIEQEKEENKPSKSTKGETDTKKSVSGRKKN
jgi:hypothetical protein